MNWDDVAEIFSILTENSPITLMVVIIIILFWSRTGNGVGMAFRDIPKYSTEAIIATYNFVLSLLRRDQIHYPPNHASSQDANDTTSNSIGKNVNDNIFSLVKKIKK